MLITSDVRGTHHPSCRDRSHKTSFLDGVRVRQSCKTSPDGDPLASRYLATWRGATVRTHVRIKAFAQALISVRLKGTRAWFERVGLERVFDERDGPSRVRELAYLALDGQRYIGSVRGAADGGALVNPVTLTREDATTLTDKADGTIVCINGGYFNHKQKASAQAPQCASIGKFVSHAREEPSLPIPQAYAHDYCALEFADGSCVQVAPRLSAGGEPLIDRNTLIAQKYDVEGRDPKWRPDIVPGSLQHAAGRHPRAALSLPVTGNGGTIRLITGLVRNRDADPDGGYDLAQWAQATRRLDRLSAPANTSVNLDGGASVALVALTADGKRLCLSQSETGRPVANLICFVEQ